MEANFKFGEFSIILVIVLLLGIMIGSYLELNYPMEPPPTYYPYYTHNNNFIDNLWDCEEGCLYAEWYLYGYKNLTSPSHLYINCCNACWYGDFVLK